jgi:hypothetical protein
MAVEADYRAGAGKSNAFGARGYAGCEEGAANSHPADHIHFASKEDYQKYEVEFLGSGVRD